jgi:nitrate/nitrite transporter NarK
MKKSWALGKSEFEKYDEAMLFTKHLYGDIAQMHHKQGVTVTTNRSQSTMLSLGFLATLNVHLLLFSYSPLIPSITGELAITNAEAGFLFSVSILTLMVFRIPWGILFDHQGFKKTMTFALALMGAFGLARGFAVDYASLLVTQFFLGVGLSGVIPAIPRLVSCWFPREKTGVATGVCLAGFPIGDFVALSFTPFVLSALGGWRQVFQVYGAWCLLLVVFWWRFAHETKNEAKPSASTSLRSEFMKLLKNKLVWVLTGLYFCAGGCYDTLLVWLPNVLQTQGFDAFSASYAASMLPAGFLVSAIIVGSFSDRVGLRKPFVLALGAVSGPALFLAGTIGGLPVYGAAFLSGVCTVGVLTMILAVPVETPSLSRNLSSVMGIVASAGNIGSFILPTLVGQLRDVSGTFLLSMLVLAVVGEGMLLLGLLLPETGGKRKPVAEKD